MTTPTKTPVILAARLFARGDFSGARAVLALPRLFRNSLSVPELRALQGALDFASRRYGAPRLTAFWVL